MDASLRLQHSVAPIENFEFNEQEYFNKNILAPQWPFRLLICGPSGSGKTNLLLNLIINYLYYRKLYIFAKDLSENKYEYLEYIFTEMHKILKKKYKLKDPIIATFQSNFDLDIDSDLNPDFQNLIVFDDFVTEKESRQNIVDLFIRGRKKNASVIYLTQSYFSVPKDIRLQCNYFTFFDFPSKREFRLIRDEHANDLTNEKFSNIFLRAIEKPYNFFFIDKKTNEKRLKYRINLEPLLKF